MIWAGSTFEERCVCVLDQYLFVCASVRVSVRMCTWCLRGDSLPAPGCQSAFSSDALTARWGGEKVREGQDGWEGWSYVFFFFVCVCV